jgi:hypothetical protein
MLMDTKNDRRAGVAPTTPRLIRQAGDKEHQPVWSPENTGHNAGTPLQREVPSLSLTTDTQGTLA